MRHCREEERGPFLSISRPPQVLCTVSLDLTATPGDGASPPRHTQQHAAADHRQSAAFGEVSFCFCGGPATLGPPGETCQ